MFKIEFEMNRSKDLDSHFIDKGLNCRNLLDAASSEVEK